MMTLLSLSECLERIFSHLLENPSVDTHTSTLTKDLYSCTLVSRHWCRISTPILYAYPFHHFRHLSYPNSSYFKLVRTLLSCVPKSEIEQIISSKYKNIQKLLYYFYSNKLKLLDVSVTFDYVSLIRGLVFNEKLSEPLLFFYRDVWLPPYIPKNVKRNQFSKISIPIMNHLMKYLCKYCNNLRTLEFPFTVQNNEYFNEKIRLLTYDNNGKSKLSHLKELYFIDKSNEISLSSRDFYSTLSNSICNLDFLHNQGVNSVEKANSLSQFISLQKKLQHIVLSEYKYGSMFYNIDYYSIVFNSLPTQKESLRTLELKYLSFSKVNEDVLKSLCSLNNIRELKLHNCRKTINDNLNLWVKNLKRLESFEFVSYYFPSISEALLIQVIQSSSNTLTKLIIDYKRSNRQHSTVFQQIPLYLNSLTHLDLPRIHPDELISIFTSCTRLVYFSTILSDDDLWEENFKNLGLCIPKSLQKIQFREVGFILDSKDLRCFFTNCEGKLKHLEIRGKFILSQEYFDIADEFGVQLVNKQEIVISDQTGRNVLP